MTNDPRPRVRAFLARFLRDYELADGEDLFQTGYVNSLLAMELVHFVEREFALRVEDDDLDLDNFRSLDAIANFVNKKKGPAP